jgi:hypothetical protein
MLARWYASLLCKTGNLTNKGGSSSINTYARRTITITRRKVRRAFSDLEIMGIVPR